MDKKEGSINASPLDKPEKSPTVETSIAEKDNHNATAITSSQDKDQEKLQIQSSKQTSCINGHNTETKTNTQQVKKSLAAKLPNKINDTAIKVETNNQNTVQTEFTGAIIFNKDSQIVKDGTSNTENKVSQISLDVEVTKSKTENQTANRMITDQLQAQNSEKFLKENSTNIDASFEKERKSRDKGSSTEGSNQNKKKKKNKGLDKENAGIGNDENIHNVALGKCTFTKLLPLPKKVVRIFISSTFTDTQAERNALMQHVYPKLTDYCRDVHGLEFQVVDMRWGVPEQASDNHSTSQLCIQEIKKCQEVSVGPNFVALVGDKYGYRPIPSEIEENVFKALEKASESIKEEIQWAVVQEWYKVDCNAMPPVYLLQPISSKLEHYNNKDNPELKKASQDKWNEINKELTTALRKTSVIAYKNGNIDELQKEQFYVSVTENEIAEGILWNEDKAPESCYCIIRKIEDIDQYVTETKASRYTDLTSTKTFDNEARNLLKKLQEEKLEKCLPESNLLKVDIEWLVSGANITVKSVDNATLVESNDDNKAKHDNYISDVCKKFLESISKLIEEGSDKQKNLYDPLTAELLQHWHLAKARCEIFEGRYTQLENIRQYLTKTDVTSPLIVHGSSGCGKTSVMAKVIENVSEKVWSNFKNLIVIPRFLGTTPNTSNLHQLLVSLCRQVCTVFNLQWEEPEKMEDLIKQFHSLIGNSTSERPLLLILDSVDQLMPAYNAFKLKWLPEKVPVYTKILISTIDEGYTIYKAFQERYSSTKYADIQINSLGEELGLQVITKWLTKDNRTMTEKQEQVIKQLLLKCSLPLYARIAYDQIKRWKSYDIPDPDAIEPTVRGAINKLFLSMEEKFGTPIVKHSLSYLTAARHGMSEAELEHVMSLDDMLLGDIFKLWIPPVRRVPPLLWTRVRTEIHSYIVERSADDILVLNWYHRQFIETTRARYLSDSAFSNHIHDHLVQLFTGKWGGGQVKPFEYTIFQVKRFGLKDAGSSKDRKVPTQPYITQYEDGGKTELRFNKRKLSEVPFHLIKTKNYKALKTNVFFKYDWLYAKLKSSSVQQVLEEFEIFMQADKVMKKDTEMKVLYANLQLMRPCLHKFPDSLPYELSGRLAKYIGSSTLITNLIKDCDNIGVKHCPFIPMVTCFETANIGFSQNIKFRSTDCWVEGGAVCCSADFQIMYILDYNSDGSPVILIYDINSGEKVNVLPIQKQDEGTTDMYSKLVLSVTKKEIFACYMQKSEGKTNKKNRDKYALIDTVDIENGRVLRTNDHITKHRTFNNPFLYTTENIICANFVKKLPVIFFRTGIQKDLDKPSLLSANEEYFIVCDRDKTTIKEFKNKNEIGEFDVAEPQLAVAGTGDFSLVILVECKTYTIRFYDLRNKLKQHESDRGQGQFIKNKGIFLSNEQMKALDQHFHCNTSEESEDKTVGTRQRAIVLISPSGTSFIIIYGSYKWIAYLYTLNMSTWNVKFVGQIGPVGEMSFHNRYPVFSHNGANIIFVNNKDINIINSQTGQTVHHYTMLEQVKDFCVSTVSNKVAVMLEKSVLMLDIPEMEDNFQLQEVYKNESNQQEQKMKQRLKSKVSQKSKLETIKEIINNCEDKTVSVLLHQDTSKRPKQPEVLLKQIEDHYVLEEIHSLAAYADTDRIATARSKRKHAVYKAFSPDGLRTIHYHTKVQVIDTKSEIIAYTPKKGDVIVRTLVNTEGISTNESIEIPGLENTGTRLIDVSLLDGDRIVHDSNKTKFRVSQETVGQFKIMNVPSVLTVYSVSDSKLKRTQSISVFKENVLTVSNSFIVTSKETTCGHFFNVYKQENGKLLATHEVKSQCQCARFSTDQQQLFVVDASLCLTGYIGPLFNSLEIKLPVTDQNKSETYSVTDIYLFEVKRDYLVLCYMEEKASVSAEKVYISVDLASKKVSKAMVVVPAFEDISDNGLFGIDSVLNVYDLKIGCIKFQLPYASYSGQNSQSKSKDSMQLVPKFGGNEHIIFVDKHDGTLHISCIVDKPVHLFSCYCHAPNLLLNAGISVVNNGQNLIIRNGKKIWCFAVMTAASSEEYELLYSDERSRAMSMMLSWCDKHQIPQFLSKDRESIFAKRKLLVQLMKEEDQTKEKPIVKEFQKESPDKPQVLVISESILSAYFNPTLFSKYLKTEKMTALTAEVATNKMKVLSTKYDVIILQLITDDVTKYDTENCIEKVSTAVECARTKARMVLLSLAPCRGDGQDINKKTQDVNLKLLEKYKSVKDVPICSNENLSNSGKPIDKYFQDGVCLSASGVKQITVNYKDTLFPILAENYWVGQRRNPSLQTSNNKIV